MAAGRKEILLRELTDLNHRARSHSCVSPVHIATKNSTSTRLGRDTRWRALYAAADLSCQHQRRRLHLHPSRCLNHVRPIRPNPNRIESLKLGTVSAEYGRSYRSSYCLDCSVARRGASTSGAESVRRFKPYKIWPIAPWNGSAIWSSHPFRNPVQRRRPHQPPHPNRRPRRPRHQSRRRSRRRKAPTQSIG